MFQQKLDIFAFLNSPFKFILSFSVSINCIFSNSKKKSFPVGFSVDIEFKN